MGVDQQTMQVFFVEQRMVRANRLDRSLIVPLISKLYIRVSGKVRSNLCYALQTLEPLNQLDQQVARFVATLFGFGVRRPLLH